MCCSLNIYIYEIYICGIFYGVFIESVRAAGVSASILQRGGGGARREKPWAPPLPCWRLILLDTQAQQYGGGCGVEERAADFDLFQVDFLLLPFPNILNPPIFFYHPWRPDASPLHVAAHLWRREPFLNHTDLCRIADFSSQAAKLVR